MISSISLLSVKMGNASPTELTVGLQLTSVLTSEPAKQEVLVLGWQFSYDILKSLSKLEGTQRSRKIKPQV